VWDPGLLRILNLNRIPPEQPQQHGMIRLVEKKKAKKKRLSEEAIKQMFLDMFFWVSENRSEWLEEAIARKKRELLSQIPQGKQ